MKNFNVNMQNTVLKVSLWVKAFIFLCLVSLLPLILISVSSLSYLDILKRAFIEYDRGIVVGESKKDFKDIKQTFLDIYANMQFEHIIIIVLCIVVSFLLLYVFMNKLRHYMVLFVKAFQATEKAHYEYRLPVYRRDECEYLIAQFNGMMGHLHRSHDIMKKLFYFAYPVDKEMPRSKFLEIIQDQLHSKDIYFMVYEHLNEVFFFVLDLTFEEQSLRDQLFCYCKAYINKNYIGKAKCNLEKLCSDLDKHLYELSENNPIEIPASFGIIDTSKMMLRYVNCGFKGGVLFKMNSIELLSSQESYLGIQGEPYQESRVELQAGNLLFFSVNPLRIESQGNAYTLRFDTIGKEISGKYLKDIMLELVHFVQDADVCVGSVLFKIVDGYAHGSAGSFFSNSSMENETQDINSAEVLKDFSHGNDGEDILGGQSAIKFSKGTSKTLSKSSKLDAESKDNIKYMRKYLDHISGFSQKEN